MIITILNGNEEPENNRFDEKLGDYIYSFEQQGHSVSQIILRDLKLQKCIGCFGCWVKSPGQCVIRDDRDLICNAVVKSDMVLHASPLKMGFVTPLIRMATERMIPTLMPYITLIDGEARHTKRYDSYAMLGLIYQPEEDSDDEDLEIARDIYTQIAAELHHPLSYFDSIEKSAEEATNEINNI
jgi:multimeric flavodoxin WrbA